MDCQAGRTLSTHHHITPPWPARLGHFLPKPRLFIAVLEPLSIGQINGTTREKVDFQMKEQDGQNGE